MAERVLSTLREQFGTHGLGQGPVTQWLWGFLSYLRQRGAVSHPELMRYAEDGNIFGFAMARNEWLPSMGERTPRPTYLTLGTHQHFDKLINARQRTWYERWMAACLGQQMLIASGMAEPIYREANSNPCRQRAVARIRWGASGKDGCLGRRENADHDRARSPGYGRWQALHACARRDGR